MANLFDKNVDLAVALKSLIAGLAGLDSADASPEVAGDRSYRTQAGGGALQILYPLRSLNGSAAFRPIPDHQITVRINVTARDANLVKSSLQELTRITEEFLAGMDRERHSSRSATDHRGWQTGAFIGFGITFFRDRSTGKPRFEFGAEPQHLGFLKLRGDAEAGINPAHSQADLVIVLESQSFTLLLDGYDRLVRYVNQSAGLQLVDCHLGAARGDAHNHLGFYDGVRNPTLESKPSALEVVLVSTPDEPAALASGSYMVFRKYSFDMEKWDALAIGEQEATVGAHKIEGSDLIPIPEGSHVHNAMAPGAPLILRRGLSYVELGPNRSSDRGLLFVSFQNNPQSFVNLHDNFLFGPGGGSTDHLLSKGLVRPITADLYFVPDHIGWGAVGQAFFEPQAFERLFEGASHAKQGRFDEAMSVYRNLVRDFPHFLPGFSNISDLAPDMGLIVEADRMADEALSLGPHDFLALSGKAWAKYLNGEYEAATNFARQAIEATCEDAMRAYPYHSLGASLIELARPVEAEAALRRSAERVNLEPLICYSLGNSLDAQKRYGEAEKIYARTLEVVDYRLRYGLISARDTRSLFNMRFIAYKSPRNQRTLASARQMLQRAPNTSTPLEPVNRP